MDNPDMPCFRISPRRMQGPTRCCNLARQGPTPAGSPSCPMRSRCIVFLHILQQKLLQKVRLAGDHQAAIPPFARSCGSARTGGCDSTRTRGGGVVSEPHHFSSSSSSSSKRCHFWGVFFKLLFFQKGILVT
jgi:hypothetical protein